MPTTTQLIPTGYKPSPLGPIPQDWEMISLGEIGETYSGLSGKSKEDFGEGSPYIPYMNIFSNPVIKDGNFDFVKINEGENQHKVENGDIFFTTSSETPEEVGMCSAYGGNNDNLYLNSFCFGIRFKEKNKYSPIFLSNFFRSNFGRKIMYKLAQGATRYNLSKQGLLKQEFGIPKVKEQTAIATILSTTDTTIQQTQEIIRKLETRHKGLVQNLLVGKIRLKGFNDERRKYKYKDILKEIKRNIIRDDNELYNLISVRRRSGGVFYREALYGRDILTKNLRLAKKGDFLISKMQIVHGASGLVTQEFDGMKISGSYIAVNSRNENILDIEFLKRYSKTPKFYHQCYISSYGVHIEKMTFDYNLFLMEDIKIPSITEQQKIIEILNKGTIEVNQYKQKLVKLQTFKKGLMQQLLTGKVRVKEFRK